MQDRRRADAHTNLETAHDSSRHEATTSPLRARHAVRKPDMRMHVRIKKPPNEGSDPRSAACYGLRHSENACGFADHRLRTSSSARYASLATEIRRSTPSGPLSRIFYKSLYTTNLQCGRNLDGGLQPLRDSPGARPSPPLTLSGYVRCLAAPSPPPDARRHGF